MPPSWILPFSVSDVPRDPSAPSALAVMPTVIGWLSETQMTWSPLENDVEFSSVESQRASRRPWAMLSELVSSQPARGHRPEPRQLIPREVARPRRALRPVRAAMEPGERMVEMVEELGRW